MEELGYSYGKVISEFKGLRPQGGPDSVLDEWKKKMESFAALTLKVMQNYRRFNIKRTDAGYMDEFLNGPKEEKAVIVERSRGHF